ncbi:MAG TPA: hypothetical protein VJ299_03925 [Steroidobacteraceae bacterium]|jgi:hypothetical protein|nr:hypothetical protein [Steroidobacteraceae bacterium]
MVTAVVILILLTVAASLASWLFGQWLAGRIRVSSTALALGGGGALLLIGTVAYLAIGATTWWQRFMPLFDAAPVIQPAAEPTPALDADMQSLLTRATFAATHPGSAVGDPVVIDPEWPATHCVAAKYSDRTTMWVLDNACDGVVAVAFQSCELGEAECRSAPSSDQRWRYEPAGILMTAANDKPVLLRVADKGPLVAPIFTIPDLAGTRRQIRYGACMVTAPRVLRLLRDSGGDEMAQQRLVAALRDDACYLQVLSWSSGDQLLTNRYTGNQQ